MGNPLTNNEDDKFVTSLEKRYFGEKQMLAGENGFPVTGINDKNAYDLKVVMFYAEAWINLNVNRQLH